MCTTNETIDISIEDAEKLYDEGFSVFVAKGLSRYLMCEGIRPEGFGAYYTFNVVFNRTDCSKFTPIESEKHLKDILQGVAKHVKALYIATNTARRLSNSLNMNITPRTVNISNTLNTTSESPIYNGSSGEFYIKGTKQKIKLGKILKTLYPQLTPLEIERYVTTWKKAYTVDTTRVKISNDIGDVYDISKVGGSCMSHKGEWMKLYEDLGCKVAYLTDNEGSLTARAIVWYNNIIIEGKESEPIIAMDRIFFEKENDKLTLETYCKEQGWFTVAELLKEDKTLSTIEACDSEYDGVPYIDSFCYLLESYHLSTSSDDYIDCLQNTQGNTECECGISSVSQGIWCVDTDEYHNEDDVMFCETNSEYYYNWEDVLVEINYQYYHKKHDENIICAYDTDTWCFINDCYYAADICEYFEEYCNLAWCSDTNNYLYSDYYYVEDLKEYWENEPPYEYNGYLYSTEDAYEEAKKEDNE